MRNIIVVLFALFGALAASANGSVSGIVRERGSGEFVIGGTVALYRDSLVEGQRPVRGAVTNRYGYYAIPDVAAGRYAIVVRFVGYQPWVGVIVVDDTTRERTLDVDLVRAETTTEEVVVEADRISQAAIDRISTVTVSPEFISQMPSFGGEVDVFRVLQMLPGVKAGSEISSGLYVRGGSPDQNLILLDGVVVYNPSHLGGFLSAFHADALRDIKLIKGAFPAQYGGRLSSVLDMSMKEGNRESIKGSGHVSLIAAGLTVDGPINDKTTFMVSGRRFYADVLLAAFAPEGDLVPQYYFYDLNCKINTELGPKDRLYLSGYFGRDVLSTPPEEDDRVDVGWGNSTANLRWTHILAPELFLSTSMIYTDYVFGTDLLDNRPWSNTSYRFVSESRIRDITLRSDLQWSASQDHLVRTGVEVTSHRFTSLATADRAADLELVGSTGVIETMDGALYAQDEWTISDAWRSNLGMRLYWFQAGGYLRLEPRASVAWDVTATTSLTASVAVAHQFLHLITRNDISLPTDLWFPSTDSVQPSRSLQAVVGLQHTLWDGEALFTVEAYVKDMQNLYEYREDATFTLGVPLASQFTSGRGIAYGVEFFLHKRLGAFTGWLGYTLAWTERTFADLNRGRPFPPRYDRRHDIAATFQYRLGESWRFGATWTFGTGQAYTMPAGTFATDPGWDNVGWRTPSQEFYTSRNGYRLAPFHKLDLHFLHSFGMFGLPFELSLNVYNAYNRQNPFALYSSGEYDLQTGEYKRVIKQLTLFPIIPTLGLRFTF